MHAAGRYVCICMQAARTSHAPGFTTRCTRRSQARFCRAREDKKRTPKTTPRPPSEGRGHRASGVCQRFPVGTKIWFPVQGDVIRAQVTGKRGDRLKTERAIIGDVRTKHVALKLEGLGVEPSSPESRELSSQYSRTCAPCWPKHCSSAGSGAHSRRFSSHRGSFSATSGRRLIGAYSRNTPGSGWMCSGTRSVSRIGDIGDARVRIDAANAAQHGVDA